MAMTDEEAQAVLAKCRMIDNRYWKRWPKEHTYIRRPYPREIEAMAMVPGSSQFALHDPKATYMIVIAKAFINGQLGHVTMADIVSEKVPPEGIHGAVAHLIFKNVMMKQGIDILKPAHLNGPKEP